MTSLQTIWIEKDPESGAPAALRVDWDNDRHQRIELSSTDAVGVMKALDFAKRLIRSEYANGEI